MPALMIQGCTSWAGKSWLVTALCRWFARQGTTVAPFKAQNMSNNARVVAGGEIGAAQWLQARAAGVAPDVRMNPVLLKPERSSDGEGRRPRYTSQVVRLGVVDRELSSRSWRGRGADLWPTARQALDDLLSEHELVIVEGAGSPAEINLAADDFVNMRVAAHADAPVLLTADIDRGGAFAHLYGTWALVGDEHRHRIRGFVLNRFRGDASLLPPGPQQLEARTGVPTIAVVPLIDHDLPDEDGASLHRLGRSGRPRVAILRYPTASNLDEFTRVEDVADVRWATAPWHLATADLVILPGSKGPFDDRVWLRDQGMDAALADAARAGTRLLGICGGLQLLGRRLTEPGGREVEGLGLLPVDTTFAPQKRTVASDGRFTRDLPRPWAGLAGVPIRGYEIREGTSAADAGAAVAVTDGLGWVRDNVLGVYVHGLLEDDVVLAALFGRRPNRSLEATFDLLADAVDDHFDTDHLRRLAGI